MLLHLPFIGSARYHQISAHQMGKKRLRAILFSDSFNGALLKAGYTHHVIVQ